MRTEVARAALASLCVASISCAADSNPTRIQSGYDKATGKLSQLTIDSDADGNPNLYSYMDGAKFIRIELDTNGDGKIDRWEYYGADQKLNRVGLSRSNNGKIDSWLYQAADGTVGKVETSSKNDATVDRVEFYDKGVLARVEQDSDRDGHPDRWETYADGELVSVGFDTTHTGRPNRIIDYRKEAHPAPAGVR
jgi:hypothetical protein